jgi:N-hydroxyarylamine O-acetyltransferase
LQAMRGSEWQNIYRFSGQPSHPIDHDVANWFTSTLPGSRFTANVIAARAADGCRKTLFNGTMTIRNLGGGTQRLEIESEAALREALQTHFGIDLTVPEAATLHQAAQQFQKRSDTNFSMD